MELSLNNRITGKSMEQKERSEEIRAGKIIRELREQKGLSIDGMAIKTGLSTDQLVQIEEGKISPALRVLIKISKALEIKVKADF